MPAMEKRKVISIRGEEIMGKVLYKTSLGQYILGDTQKLIERGLFDQYKNKVQLILTSPPFPLNKEKSSSNLKSEQYKEWFAGLSELFSELLTDDGSIVIELENSWIHDKPVQSLLQFESLLGFVNNPKAKLRLCQEFICHKPSHLLSPSQWVTVDRIRTIDSFTRIWWMAKSDFPKADNKKVLRHYSESMEQLPQNILSIADTQANDHFIKTCQNLNFTPHPAQMPLKLASFFIQFLTDENDIVLDPFAGTNTTGYCAEQSGRKWLAVEIDKEFGKQSIIRFKEPKDITEKPVPADMLKEAENTVCIEKGKKYRIKPSERLSELYFEDKYGTKNPIIKIEGTDREIFGCYWELLESPEAVSFAVRIGYDGSLSLARVFYGKVKGMNEFVREDELVPVEKEQLKKEKK